MATYRVYASQEVFYYKDVEAKSKAEAEEIAWEQDEGGKWEEFQFGDWRLEEGTEKL